ncbi:uncharacterized protein B0T15DRAFT_571148 [Chaetomium strumarium]|uniref:DUF7707 domain-containing protein n=1 Tax=Chaetomium strumarium TaxID=1170767 RepID=A0AAJ0H2G0_9PEZI|nr:hypothetical protein B0T15DRAFT_571148 [Chaetomium strumarium]
MRQNILVVALSALTVASAQSNFTINPNEVDPTTRSDWCQAEYNSCNLLCGSNVQENDCAPDTLNYTCTCSNGSAPGLQYYIQTMPTFICEQAYSDCIEQNTGNSRGQDKCKSDIQEKCGTLDPTKAQVDSGSDSSTTSATTAAPSATESTAQNAPASSTSRAGAAATNSAYIGNGAAVVAAGLFAALL